MTSAHCLAYMEEVHPLEDEVRVGAIWMKCMAWSDLLLCWCTAGVQAVRRTEVERDVGEREVQIVDLHGVSYVQDLWKVLSQDVRAG